MLAVRPNWGFASAGRLNLHCVINVKVDAQGKVLQTTVTRGSGNAQFDASAVNAIIRTSQSGQFPPPPSADYSDLDLVFTLDELMRPSLRAALSQKPQATGDSPTPLTDHKALSQGGEGNLGTE